VSLPLHEFIHFYRNIIVQLKPNLLELLNCPVCKSGEGLEQQEKELHCLSCKQVFKLKQLDGPDGQGVLMPDFLEFEDK